MPMRVSVACSEEPGSAFEVDVDVSAGASAHDAIRAAGILARFPRVDPSSCALGVWGRPATLDTVLRDGDRVKLYRPLAMEPMQARRLRATRRRPG